MPKPLRLNAKKVGGLTIQDLAEFAESQGAYLVIQFVSDAPGPEALAKLNHTGRLIADALE